MRRKIQEFLVSNCPSFEGRFYYPGDPDASTQKPYGVLKIGRDIQLDAGRNKRFQVWVYQQERNWEGLDALASEVEEALTDAIIDSKIHVKSDGRAIEDFPDPELRAATTRIDFHYYK